MCVSSPGINIWWLIVRTGSLGCLLPHHRTRLKTQGTFGCTLHRKSVANSEVSFAVPMLRWPDKSLFPHYSASPGCIMVLWQTVWLWLKSCRQTQSGHDKRAGAPKGCSVEWGSPAFPGQGFPHSHLACVNSRLAQAHSSTLTSALPQCPHTTSCSMAQTMNKRPYLRTAAHRGAELSRAEQKGDTSWRQLPTTAGRSAQRVRNRKLDMSIPMKINCWNEQRRHVLIVRQYSSYNY